MIRIRTSIALLILVALLVGAAASSGLFIHPKPAGECSAGRFNPLCTH